MLALAVTQANSIVPVGISQMVSDFARLRPRPGFYHTRNFPRLGISQ